MLYFSQHFHQKIRQHAIVIAGTTPVPSPLESFGGLIPPNKAPSPLNWNMKHYKLVEFLSNLNVKPPGTNVKPPRTNVKPPC